MSTIKPMFGPVVPEIPIGYYPWYFNVELVVNASSGNGMHDYAELATPDALFMPLLSIIHLECRSLDV